MVRVSSPAKLRPWSELTAKMVMGVFPGLVILSNRSSQKSRDFGALSPGESARNLWVWTLPNHFFYNAC